MAQRTDTIQVRVDPATKAAADAVFADLGVPTATAINIFLKMAIREGGFPFPVKQARYNAETESAIDEARQLNASGEGYRTKDELIEALRS